MMKNVSTTVNKPLDLCDSLYDLRKAKGALSALCDELDEFGDLSLLVSMTSNRTITR
jgi:hypothetical protein